MKHTILYKRGYKYQLAFSFRQKTNIKPLENIKLPFLELSSAGYLNIKVGYAWDGPSGPVIDTKRKMRASLVHDAFYQLRRNKFLSERDMIAADMLFKNICIEDGLASWRAHLYYKALRRFGMRARNPRNKRAVISAP